jgi:hypothetical protein
MRRKMRDTAASRRAQTIGLMLLYLAVSLALLPHFRHAINPDGVSYISIARRVLAGDWHGAVNGYWGPLYSWALVPFLALRIDPLLACKLLSILIGLASIPGLQALASRFPLSGRQRLLMLAALLPALWRFTFTYLTPDFLLACILAWYFSVILAPGYPDRRRNAVLCGALGALAYFAKAYGFYFFLAHYALATALLAWGAESRDRQRAVLRNAALGFAVFALLAGAWIAVLSDKYGGFTLATSARYNHAMMAPDSPGHPMKLGFLAPADPAAISIWEDPSALAPPDWRATDSADLLKYQGILLLRNLRVILRIFLQYAPLLPFILLAFLLVCLRDPRRSARPGGPAHPLLALALYPAGYALLLVRERYLFACLFLLALMGAQLLCWLERKGWLAGRRQAAAWLLLALSLTISPAVRGVKLYRTQARMTFRADAAALAKRADFAGAPIASNREWARTLYLAYHLDARYYGQNGLTPDSGLLPALARLGIRYYFLWNGSEAEQARLLPFPDVSGGAVPRLRVYRLDEKALEAAAAAESPSVPITETPPPARRKARRVDREAEEENGD